MSDEVKVDFPTPAPGTAQQGEMSIELKDDRGYTLTKKYGFTVEEEPGQVLAFDFINHPSLGNALLFGQQVFVLKFWDTEDLIKGRNLINDAVYQELQRRERLGIR